jgi:uncharacterized coiled-coil protein SlyX
MRHCAAICLVLVTWGHCVGLAAAQTQRPLTMFDLFEMEQSGETVAESGRRNKSDSADQTPTKSMFDLFQSKPRRSRAAANIQEETVRAPLSKQAVKTTLQPKHARLPSAKSPNTEVASLAKKKKRLDSLASSLSSKRGAQEKEARHLNTAAVEQKQEMEKPSADELDLEAIRKLLDSDQFAVGTTPAPPAKPPHSLNADAGKHSIAVPHEPTFNRSSEVDQTRIARVEPNAPTAPKWEDARLKSSGCQKAKAVIEGYAFTDVRAKSCVGDSYLFSATRDKNTFSIKINSQTWELTEVAKAAPQASTHR